MPVKKQDLDTPFVLIDLDKMEHNIAAMQRMADQAGVALRPHAKTHKLPQAAHMQIGAGAIGVTVAKLGEAEVMAAAGVPDILVAYPVIGAAKLERLAILAGQTQLTVAIDSLEAARGISQAALFSNVVIDVLIEVDCGFGRCGVKPGFPVLALAQEIDKLPNIAFKGLLTFPGQAYDAVSEEQIIQVNQTEGQIVSATIKQLNSHGFQPAVVSGGSTPTARFVNATDGLTEIRPGTYVFGDLTQVKNGAHLLQHCALTVKVTVVSVPERGRAIIDAGTKILTMDGEDSPIGTGRGAVVGRAGIHVAWRTEEHGILTFDADTENLCIGDQLVVIPVHACAVINMVDEVAAVRGERVEAVWQVAGRGKSQ